MRWRTAVLGLAVGFALWTIRAPGDPPPTDPGHIESPVLPPPQSPAPQATSPAARIEHGSFVSIQVNINFNGVNINNDAANEPSMAIDPTNPDRIVIGWRQFSTINDSFRRSGYSYSHDGGETWLPVHVLENQIFSSDPVLAADADGRIYYYALQPSRGPGEWACYMYRSSNGGVTWPQERYAYGGDKAWFTIDQTGGIGRGNIYIVWSPFAPCCGVQNRFTRSTNGGFSFIDPVPFPGSISSIILI